MFARLTVYEHVDLDLADRVRAFMEAQDADPFAGLPGLRGSMTLVDRDNARLVGLGFYESGDQARDAGALMAAQMEEALDQVPDAIRPALAMRPATVGVYEVVHRD